MSAPANPIKVFTIGFTKTSAGAFFEELRDAGVKRVVDVRLNNVSQLAGFAKRDDLRFFLNALYGIEYVHLTELAPTQPMLDEYKKNGGAWSEYEIEFLELLRERRIQDTLDKSMLESACLLCSEETATHCHRRLVVEYLQKCWGNLEFSHLMPSRRRRRGVAVEK